jgi:hypothetical protein
MRLPASIEVISNDAIGHGRGRLVGAFRLSAKLLSVLVVNLNSLVAVRVCPRARQAVLFASTTLRAFRVVALLTERLDVRLGVDALGRSGIAASWNAMVRRQLHVRFLFSADGAPIAGGLFQPLPHILWWIAARRSLRARVQTLQLVLHAFLANAREALFALQFTDTAEHVLVVADLTLSGASGVYARANIILCDDGTRNAMSIRPEPFQNPAVVLMIGWRGRDKTITRGLQPRRTISWRVSRLSHRLNQKSFAGSSFCHRECAA